MLSQLGLRSKIERPQLGSTRLGTFSAWFGSAQKISDQPTYPKIGHLHGRSLNPYWHDLHCKPKPCTAYREIPAFIIGEPCSHCRFPVFITGFSLYFPVLPCKGLQCTKTEKCLPLTPARCKFYELCRVSN